MAYKRINQIYFMADTVEDLPNITGTLRMGAECFVIAESCEYKYTSEGTWVKQISSSGSGEPVDLTGYALKTDIPDVSNLQQKGDYALRSELPSTSGFATEDFVTNQIAALTFAANGFNGIGMPQIYTTSFDNSNMEVFANVDAIYAAFDELATQHPHMFKKNNSIGMDASNTYAINYYTLGQSNPKVTTDRVGNNSNQWDDTKYLRRRILINGNIHSWVERHCVYGLYLFVKEILESNEQWALFIKNNLILDIIPQPNPWGYDNKTNVNVNGKNLNRTYLNNLEAENQCLVDLIESLIPRGLVAIIDLHNTNDSTPGYTIGKTSQKYWNYLCVLASQIESLTHNYYKDLYGADRDSFYHMWCYDNENISGLLNDYADTKGLLCYTSEVGTSLDTKGCIMTKMILVNTINALATYAGLSPMIGDSIPNIPSIPDEEPELPTVGNDITDKFTWNAGGAIEATTLADPGGVMSTSLFQYSNFVDISETPDIQISFLKWNSSKGAQPTLGYALYNADKAYVGGQRFDHAGNEAGNSEGVPYMLDVHITDTSAKYIRVCWPTDTAKYGEFKAYILN